MHQSKQTARAVIFDPEGRLLVVERHKAGEHYFVLPGGHVDEGETYERAVEREVQEETGLRVTVQKQLYTSVDKYHHDQRIYLCLYQSGEPRLQKDSIEAQLQSAGEPQSWESKWCTFDELRDKTVYPKDLLRYLEEDRALNYHHNPYKIIERQV